MGSGSTREQPGSPPTCLPVSDSLLFPIVGGSQHLHTFSSQRTLFCSGEDIAVNRLWLAFPVRSLIPALPTFYSHKPEDGWKQQSLIKQQKQQQRSVV